MALPRYQNIGVAAGGNIDRLPGIDFPSPREASRGLDALSGALDVMSQAFFGEAQIAATEEGRAYGAEMAPSQEQIKLAVETGTPIAPIGDARTYFGRAAREVSTRIAAIGVEAQAQQDLKRIKEGISTGAIGPGGVMPQVNSLIQGYSTALGQFDPVMGRKLQAELAKDGNTLFLAATARAAAAAAAAAKKSITDVADAKLDNVKFVLEAGDRVVVDSTPMGEQTTTIMPVKDMVRIEKEKLVNTIRGLKPKEQEKYLEDFDKELVKGVELQVSNAILNGDVTQVKKDLVSGEYRDLLREKPEARYTLIGRIDAYERQVAEAERQQNRIEAGRYEDQINNAKSALINGRTDVDLSFYSREKTAKLFPEKADKVNRDLESAIRIGAEVSTLAFATVAEQDAALQRMASAIKTNDPDYINRQAEFNAVKTAIQNNRTALNDDPALYVNRNPVVREAAVQMQRAITDPNISEADRRKAIDNYARTSLDLQGYLGVDVNKRRILTKENVEIVKSQMISLANSGENKATIMQDQANRWGKEYWPAVWRQLDLPSEYNVIGSMVESGQMTAARSLADAMRPDMKSGIDKSVSADSKKLVDEAVMSLAQPFKASLAFRLGGPEQYLAYEASIKTLANYYMFNGITAPKDAAEKAYRDVIGNAYQFVSTSNEVVRIPNVVDGKPLNISSDAIGFGLALARKRLEEYNIVPYRSFQGVDAGEAYRQTLVSLKSYGRFITNGDQTGVVLVDETGRVVNRVAEGPAGEVRPFNLTWAELNALGQPVTEKPFLIRMMTR